MRTNSNSHNSVKFLHDQKYKWREIKKNLPTWRYILWCIVRRWNGGPEIYKNNVLIHKIINSTTLDHSKIHLDLLVCCNSLILLGRALRVLRCLAVPGSGRSIISLFKKNNFLYWLLTYFCAEEPFYEVPLPPKFSTPNFCKWCLYFCKWCVSFL